MKKNIISNRFYNFFKLESFGGILLILITLFAIIAANSPVNHIYHHFIHLKLGVKIGHLQFVKSLSHWVNDALMAIFFVVVGLEIKREVLIGELSTVRKALLPMFAAIGGMVVPALIYFFINRGETTAMGWGIPMATDIAFALGILSLAGKKFPLSLKVFLTAFAIIDDIGGVIVIAVFYSSHIYYNFLALAFAVFIVMLVFNFMKVHNPVPYSIAGIIMWIFMFKSGVHATLAGLLTAFAIPAKGAVNIKQFLREIKIVIKKIEKKPLDNMNPLLVGKKTAPEIQTIEEVTHNFIPPLLKIEHTLHPWVTFAILPFFAFVNAGLELHGNFSQMIFNKASLGIILGLVLGKQIGILLFSFLAVKSKICILPNGINWKMMYAVSILGGIGFTMSLFVSSLAFASPDIIDQCKFGILTASLISSVLGIIALKFSKG